MCIHSSSDTPRPDFSATHGSDIVNGEKNSLTITVENKSDKNVTLRGLGGSLYNPETDALIKNVRRVQYKTWSECIIHRLGVSNIQLDSLRHWTMVSLFSRVWSSIFHMHFTASTSTLKCLCLSIIGHWPLYQVQGTTSSSDLLIIRWAYPIRLAMLVWSCG